MHGVLADAAKALNMTPKDLKTELQKGQSIVQIAKGKGISEAQLTATLKSDLQTRLNKAVQNGKLTQAQAQSRLSRFDTHIGKLLNRQGFPHKKTLAQSGNSASGAQSSN